MNFLDKKNSDARKFLAVESNFYEKFFWNFFFLMVNYFKKFAMKYLRELFL